MKIVKSENDEKSSFSENAKAANNGKQSTRQYKIKVLK